jgi:hypothetical protein
MSTANRVSVFLKSRNIGNDDILAGISAMFFLGDTFLLGALIKSKKVAALVFVLLSAFCATSVLYVQKNESPDIIDPLGEQFIFGSVMVSAVATISIGYVLRFVAGFLAGMAWRSRHNGKHLGILILSTCVVYFAAMTPLRLTAEKLIESQGRIEAKMEFYGATTKALDKLEKSNPTVDFTIIKKLLEEQVRSVVPH